LRVVRARKKLTPVGLLQHHPVLSAFCTELTGIQQEQVDPAPTFDEAFSQYMQWLMENVRPVNLLVA
jgi:inhibitor of KinA sporulation pathway (predicted exonuclease)